MYTQETLYQESISTRELPLNFDESDSELFRHELEKHIPPSTVYHLQNVTINSDGILFFGNKVIPVSFPAPQFSETWTKPANRLKSFIKNNLPGNRRKIDRPVFWITDTWSHLYFHWMTDALSRLFIVREKIARSTLLLPAAFENEKYITASLKPFFVSNVEFIRQTVRCKNLMLPAHTAPTGNYNENIIRGLSSFYTKFYQSEPGAELGDKIYISRSQAEKRKIANEAECIAILEEYDFRIVRFEDYSFDEQVKIAADARYLIANHGAGLTNMLFMKSGGAVLELRKKADAHNNCYFALANALQLNYFYQICDSENNEEDAHRANLIVDSGLLRKNIEQMLKK